MSFAFPKVLDYTVPIDYNQVMARPLEFDKNVALEKAMDVFWEKGFEATSLQDLIVEMGLSKSSFYQAFGGKLELFSTALNHYTDSMAANMATRLESTPSGIEFIRNTFMEIVAQARTDLGMKGCFLMNTASEFAQRDTEIAALTKGGVKKFESVFFKAIEKSQKAGEISSEKDAHSLAYFLVCNMSGLKTMVKAGAKRRQLRAIVDTLLASLN